MTLSRIKATVRFSANPQAPVFLAPTQKRFVLSIDQKISSSSLCLELYLFLVISATHSHEPLTSAGVGLVSYALVMWMVL